MSSTVKYKGSPIATVSNNTKTLKTAGKYMEDDVEITDISQAAPTLQTKNKAYTPSTSQQTEAVEADNGFDGLERVNVTVNAMPIGSASPPLSISGSSASVSPGTNKLTLSKSVSVTPVVSPGYVAAGSTENVSVSLEANVATQGAQTFHPSTSDQTINGSRYLTGNQTIKGVTLTNLLAENIKEGVTVNVGDSTDDDCVASVLGTYAGGGGATNVVRGSFTTGSTRGSAGTFTINYTGSGYPIALMIYVKGGAYNNSSGGNTTWYNSVNRYDVGWYSMTKSRTTTSPTFTTSGADNQGTVAIIYKNSTSTATSYSRTSSMTANTFTSSSTNANNSTGCVRFKGNKTTVSYYVGNSGSNSIGFAPATEYEYIAIYSS